MVFDWLFCVLKVPFGESEKTVARRRFDFQNDSDKNVGFMRQSRSGHGEQLDRHTHSRRALPTLPPRSATLPVPLPCDALKLARPCSRIDWGRLPSSEPVDPLGGR